MLDLADRGVAALARSAALEMRCDLDEHAWRITRAIHDACPDLPDGLAAETHASTLSNIACFTTVVEEGLDPTHMEPPREAEAYARRFARSGLEIELLTRAYRHGEHAFRQMWKQQLQTAIPEPDAFTATAMWVEDGLFAYISTVTRSLAAQHADEQERASSPALLARVAEVRRILSGAQVDPTISSQRLRYRLDGPHTAFVIWHDRSVPAAVVETPDSLAQLARAAESCAAALGSTNTLGVQLGDLYAGWANVAAVPPRELSLPEGVHGVFGIAHRGVEGFRRSHQEALQGRRVVSLGGPGRGASGGAARFADLALDALLTSDLEEARCFVTRQLGELSEAVGPRARIVETLEAYLLSGSSLARVSRQLGVHENTVAYRLRRAEEILERPIDAHRLELEAALRIARLLRNAGSTRNRAVVAPTA